MSAPPLGPKRPPAQKKQEDEGPEWLPVKGRPGLYRHRDPPHRMRFDPPYYRPFTS